MPSNAPSHPSLYRTIFHDAFSTAWHHPRLWVLAAFASLLMTGGIYDVVARALYELGSDAERLVQTTTNPFATNLISWVVRPFHEIGGALGVFASVTSVLGIITMVSLMTIIAAGSIIAQSALVYGLGIRLQGRVPTLGQCLTIGARFFWKTLFFNLLTLGTLWVIRSLTLIPLTSSYGDGSSLAVAGRALAIAVYMLSIVFLTSTHMLGLTSLVLQKYSVTESFIRGLIQSKERWYLVLELGASFFLLGAGLFAALMVLYVVAGVPLVVLALSAALVNNSFAASALNIALYGGAILAFMTFGAFAITVQYSAWNQLALRIAQGTALAKLHRWFLSFKPSSR